MKRNRFWVIGLIGLLLSCQDKNKRHEEFFKQNFASFDSISTYIGHEIKAKKFGDNQIGLLFTLHWQYSEHNNIIFDPKLAAKMNRLNIKQIRCDTEKKDACGIFDVIYFQLMANENPDYKVVYYVFDRCDNFKNFKNRKIYQKKIMKNWGILIEQD